jgi:integrase
MIPRKAKYRIKFGRRIKTKDPNKLYPVEIDCYLQAKKNLLSERKIISTTIQVYYYQWNEKDKEVNYKHAHYVSLNRRIRDLINQFEEIEEQYRTDRKPFHLDYLDTAPKEEKERSFTKFWQWYIDHNPKSLRPGTLKTKKTALKYFKEFNHDVPFSDIKLEMILDYEVFLLEYEYYRQDEYHTLKPSFIHSLFKDMKAVLKVAQDRDLIPIEKNPFLKFSIQKYAKYGNTIKYLTPEEVQAIENLTFEKDQRHLIKIRDFFLLGVYTGLRYGDLIRLNKSHLVESEGDLSIDIIQEKTGDRVVIPVSDLFNRKGLHIIKTYLIGDRKYIFDDLTNQHVNRSLKVIASMAGIDKNLTCHMARHSCATILLNKGLQLEYVKEILGHSSLQSTQVYAKVMRKALKNELAKIEF